jgi:hypothetical protein
MLTVALSKVPLVATIWKQSVFPADHVGHLIGKQKN